MSLFAGQPLAVFAVAVAFLGGYLALRQTSFGKERRPGPLLVAAIAWGLYAGWEWLVVTTTPEANIRVDLLLLWPALGLLFWSSQSGHIFKPQLPIQSPSASDSPGSSGEMDPHLRTT